VKYAHVCAEPGCGAISEATYCPAHTATHRADAEQRRRPLDRDIKARSPWRWVYKSRRWQLVRRQVLFEQPVCAGEGCIELSVDVDHIVPLQDGGPPFERTNLQGLCVRDHAVKTRQEVSRAARRLRTNT
jgi:5-methylcytosine-specific restriction endonuclease McrA